MQRRITNSKLLTSGWFSLGFLVLGAIGSVLYCPKWHNQVFARIGPFCLWYFFRLCYLKGKFLWFAFENILVYLASADRWLTTRTGHFLSTLFFPSAYVIAIRYYSARSGDRQFVKFALNSRSVFRNLALGKRNNVKPRNIMIWSIALIYPCF